MSVAGASDRADPLGSLIIRNLAPERATGGTTRRRLSRRRHSPCWRRATTPGPTRPSTPTRPCTRASTTSPCGTASGWPPRCGTPMAGPARPPAPAPPSSSTPATTWPVPPIPSPSSSPRPSIRRARPAATRSCSPTAPPRSGSVLARVSGFATVSLQMRGTGCSGGSFDLFGYPSDYDAYDAIEIAAHQNWVAHHQVGMVGISYSGLSQFPAAGTDPPGLAAIAPMSPTDDLFSTGYPGGIYNDGFAASWIHQRIDDARPAALPPWPPGLAVHRPGGRRRPALGLRGDRRGAGRRPGRFVDVPGQPGPPRPVGEPGHPGRAQAGRPRDGGHEPEASLFDRRSMVDWAGHVKVPVFLSGALQDEQTGPAVAGADRCHPGRERSLRPLGSGLTGDW